MADSNVIHVAMASDDNYCKYLSVAICSIIKNLSKDHELCIYLLNEILTDETKRILEHLKYIRLFNIVYVDVNCEQFASFKVLGSQYISRLTYARFQLPRILNTLDRCLYLDCDIVVRQDLSELWDIQLPGGAVLGAVEEPCARHRNVELGISDNFSYFNAGILLLDLNRLRQARFEEIAFEFLKEKGSLLYADQDVINALFYDKWHPLPIKWNVHSTIFTLKNVNIFYRYSVQEVVDAFSDVAIVHYSQGRKPDSFICENPYRDDYWLYKKHTLLKCSLPTDITPVTIMIRSYWSIKRIISKMPAIFISLRSVKRIFTCYYFNKSR